MGIYAGQKYRYGKLVVSVIKLVAINDNLNKYECRVRGYGYQNTAPRGKYELETETNAKASRIALQMYKKEFPEQHGQEIK